MSRRIIKMFRKQQVDALIDNPNSFEDKSLIIGFCQGYDSIISLLEESIKESDNIKEILETFIYNAKEFNPNE